jgi:hypothetical protein
MDTSQCERPFRVPPPRGGGRPAMGWLLHGCFLFCKSFSTHTLRHQKTKDRPWRSLALSTCPFPLSLGISTPPLEILARSGTRSHLSLSAPRCGGPPPLVRSLLTSPRQMKTIGRHHRAGEPTGLAHGLWASTHTATEHRLAHPPGKAVRCIVSLSLCVAGWKTWFVVVRAGGRARWARVWRVCRAVGLGSGWRRRRTIDAPEGLLVLALATAGRRCGRWQHPWPCRPTLCSVW